MALCGLALRRHLLGATAKAWREGGGCGPRLPVMVQGEIVGATAINTLLKLILMCIRKTVVHQTFYTFCLRR